MGHNTGIEIPEWMRDEVDKRSMCPRGQYIREAVQARLEAEDAGEWTTPDIDETAVELTHLNDV